MESNYKSLDEWIAREAISFSLTTDIDAAIDVMIARVGDRVEVLGIGEAMHGGEEFLVLRNLMLKRVVEKHGFSAIAVESSCSRSRIVNDYVNGMGESYEAIAEGGFSHGFGKLVANREMIEWMRGHNARSSDGVKVEFYGFDAPTEMTGTESPRRLICFVLDYLEGMDQGNSQRRERIESLIGDNAGWENPAAMMDPSKSIGGSDRAKELRLEVEGLVAEMELRRPELLAREGSAHALRAGCRGDARGGSAHALRAGCAEYLEARQNAVAARWMLDYHASGARESNDRIAEMLGLRDVMMAENLMYARERERVRGGGKILVFAHNSHLKRGQAKWQLGPHALSWWPCGAQMDARIGERYTVIGAAVGESVENGIGKPEPGTFEAKLMGAAGEGRFVATHRGEGISIGEMPVRSGGKNPTYFPLDSSSAKDFNALVLLDGVSYTRGGPVIPR